MPVTERKIMWEKRKHDEEKEKVFLDKGASKFVARLAAQRNVDPETFENYLNPTWQEEDDPFKLNDVEKAARLFCQIAKDKGKVGVIGDYDCDGIISSTMLKSLCDVFELDCKVFLPSRLEHGYGLSPKTIESFKEKLGTPPDLLMVTDCGSNNESEIVELKEWGVKHIIIIDHHVIDQEKLSVSADAIISWHLSGTPEMCACGEAFQFIRGIRKLTKKVNPIEFMAYAAFGTISDVSPIANTNRMLVRHGLTSYSMNHVVSHGLRALANVSKVKEPSLTQQDVGFKLAPRINATGRITKPDVALSLLLNHDPTSAEDVAERMNQYNDERKKLQKSIEEEAMRMVESNIKDFEFGIAVCNPEWHVGVIGIVASKIVEKYNKPTLVLGGVNGVIKGSGRSVEGVDLKSILDSCSEIFDAYGGHSAAAGATLKNDCQDALSSKFNEACKEYYKEHEIEEVPKYYDAVLPVSRINKETTSMLLENIYPYCNINNKEPVFLSRSVKVSNLRIFEGEGWRLLTFKLAKDGEESELKLTMFSDDYGEELDGMTCDVYFSLPQQLKNGDFDASGTVVELIPNQH
jgi:single-stranded-DNA-specific exonuclease